MTRPASNGSIIGATQDPTPTSAGGIWTLPAQLELQKQGKWIAPGYNISRSLRFNSADSSYLSRTPAIVGNRKTWTWSGWVKRSALDVGDVTLFGTGTAINNANFNIFVFRGNTLTLSAANVEYFVSSSVYRDVSAWYHIVLSVDTTQATTANRLRLYVNGEQVTLSTGSFPAQNTDLALNNNTLQTIGATDEVGSLNRKFNGYLTEIHFVDGQALDPSYFGVVDTLTGVWRPKQVEDMNYGTNGFYLPFSDNSDVTATTLGRDFSGNGNNWTPSGSPGFSVAAGANNDSLVDTPTPYGTDTGAGGEVRGNYATFNPTAVSGMGLATLANGNLNASGDGTLFKGSVSTIAMSTGKWYWETTIVGGGNTYGPGIVASTSLASAIGGSYGYTDASDAWMRSSNGVVYSGGAGVVTGLSTFTTDDVISIAVDFDAGKLWFAKNGTWDSSGNPATGANPTITFSPGGKSFYAMVQGWVYAPYTWTMALNAGQRPFAYTAPSGFKALVTTNLPEPTVVQGDDYFNTVLFTGNSSGASVTGVGFQPDFVWMKCRSTGRNHELLDAVRGGSSTLFSNLTNQEATQQRISSFNSDGFTYTIDSNSANSGDTYAAWNWKAGDANVDLSGGANISNGTVGNATVRANTTSGFSIVSTTNTTRNGSVMTIPHGLNSAPDFILCKSRDADNIWTAYNSAVANDGLLGGTSGTDAWIYSIYSSVGSSTFGHADNSNTQSTGEELIFYCFAEVEGFSKFGSYTGNGSADGPFVYTGFRPAFVMFKITSGVDSWVIYDSVRNTYNVVNNHLYPSTSGAEYAATSTFFVDFVSNGFKVRGASDLLNGSGSTYIYMAFATSPFKFALAR